MSVGGDNVHTSGNTVQHTSLVLLRAIPSGLLGSGHIQCFVEPLCLHEDGDVGQTLPSEADMGRVARLRRLYSSTLCVVVAIPCAWLQGGVRYWLTVQCRHEEGVYILTRRLRAV